LSLEEWSSGKEEEINEEMINIELRKTPTGQLKNKTSLKIITAEVIMINSMESVKVISEEDISWYLQKSLKHPKILCAIAWMLRFISNC